VTSAELLIDAFGRVQGIVHRAVGGLTRDQLAFRVEEGSNSISWLVWHLTRIQDDHIAEVADTEQIWMSGGWADRFGLPFKETSTGYGHSPKDVAAVQAAEDLLTGYHDATFDRTVEYVQPLTDADLGAVVDESYDPPVTLGVRLVSVISDNLQHAGQAAFIRGIIERR
jgi:Protein of unknown function (DUF664)